MSSLLKNWTFLFLSDISQTIINFFVFIVLARKLTPEGYGEFNVILAVAMLFTVFANNLGSNLVVTREVTVNPKSTGLIVRNSLILRGVSFFVSIIGLWIYSEIKLDLRTDFIFFISILIFTNSIWDLSESISFGHFTAKYTSILNVLFSCVWLISIFVLPEEYLTLLLVIVFYCTNWLLRSLSYIFIVFKKFVVNNNLKIQLGIKSLFVMSLPYFWMRSLGSLSEQLPIIFLNDNNGSEEVAFYSVGAKLIIPITLTITTANRAVFPFLTKLFKENRIEFNKKVLQGFNFIFLIGSLIATFLTLTSSFWIPAIFGAEYIGSVASFNILAWFAVGLSFDLLLSTVLSSTYKHNLLGLITTIDFVVIFPILYYGTTFGAVGLSIAKLFSLFIVLVYHGFVVQKVLHIHIFNKTFIQSLIFFFFLIAISTIDMQSIILRIAIIALFIILYTAFPKSPIREAFRLIFSKFFPLENRGRNVI